MIGIGAYLPCKILSLLVNWVIGELGNTMFSNFFTGKLIFQFIRRFFCFCKCII